MELDANKLVVDAVRDGLREAVKSKITGYNSPFDELIKSIISSRTNEFRELLESGIHSAVGDANFREEIQSAVRKKLASTLVQRFGGEIEKQVNVLKSDPTTRARITLAIEEIVKTAPK